MKKDISTRELENTLHGVHPDDIGSMIAELRGSFADENGGFQGYVRSVIDARGYKQVEVFRRARVPERYGYKLLSGEKHTSQRDTLIRILAAADMTKQELQRALRLYGLPELYARNKRDFAILAAIEGGKHDPDDIDEVLKKEGFAPLAPCGAED